MVLKSLDLKSRRGSVTIFAALFFITLTSMVMAFVHASKERAVAAGVERLGSVWTASVLSEYDRNLQDRYGLFAYYGTPQVTGKKLLFYGNESFRGKGYLDFEGVDCQLYPYSLASVAQVRKQIVRVGEYAAAGKLKSLAFQTDPVNGGGNPYFSGPDSGAGGVIRNQRARAALPSAGSPAGISLEGLKKRAKGMTSLATGLRRGTDAFFEEYYLFQYFKDGQDSRGLGRTFFRNELEYVICGEPTDEANLSGVKWRIVAIREAANLAFLLKDPTKQALIMELATALATPAGAPAAAAALSAGWALVESVNDYKLLIRGKVVPFMKDEKSWATDLESILTGKPGRGTGSENTDEEESGASGPGDQALPELKKEVGCIDPGNRRGENYQAYLKFMTACLDEDIRVLRMMDLIQLNMQAMVSPGFCLKDHYSGIQATFRVNGKQYEVENEYQPEKP